MYTTKSFFFPCGFFFSDLGSIPYLQSCLTIVLSEKYDFQLFVSQPYHKNNSSLRAIHNARSKFEFFISIPSGPVAFLGSRNSIILLFQKFYYFTNTCCICLGKLKGFVIIELRLSVVINFLFYDFINVCFSVIWVAS